MEPKRILNISAKTLQMLMTIFVFWLIIIVIVEITSQISGMIIYKKYYLTRSNLYSRMCFMPNGYYHRLDITLKNNTFWDANNPVKIYDSNDNVIWKGVFSDIQYDYLNLDDYKSFYLYRFRSFQKDDTLASQDKKVSATIGDIIWEYDNVDKIFKLFNTKDSNEIISLAGADGFVGSDKRPVPFEEPVSAVLKVKSEDNKIVYWLTEHRLYKIDFINKKVDIVIDVGPDEICLMAYNIFTEDDADAVKDKEIIQRPLFCVYTNSKKFYLSSKNPEQNIVTELPENCGSPYFIATTNDIFLITHNKPSKGIKNHLSKLYKVDNDGKLFLLQSSEWQERIKDNFSLADARRLYCGYAAQSYPLAGELISKDAFKNYQRERENIETFFKDIILQTREGDFSKKIIVTAVFIFLALWHSWARRASWVKFGLWLVFIALFNLAGFLTYLALNHTAVIKCPACGKKRNLERSDCVRCGDNLLKPGPKPLILSQK